MIIGKLHLKDFPAGVYLLLKDDFRRKLIQKCAHVARLNYKGLSRHLGVPYQTLLNWKAGRRAIQIQALQKMLSMLQTCPILSKLNKNVMAYKMRSGKLITNPNLPIIFDERAVTLLVHLMADGYVADGQMPSYCNYDLSVLGEMKRSLKMFGDVPIRERDKKKGKEILIPTIVIKLLEKFFGKIQFGSHETRIPESIKSMPPAIAAAAIRAFADDEAAVLRRCIRFYSANPAFLEDIRFLLHNKFSARSIPNGIPESAITQITISTIRSSFYFDITSKGLKPYQELIGFTHSRKRLKLAYWVDRISKSNWHNNPDGVTREKILKEFQKGPKTAEELSKATGVKSGVINSYFLKRLAREGRIMLVKKVGTKNLWALKSRKMS